MDIVDKYFEIAGDVIDDKIIKYMGLNRDQEREVQKRLSDKLGREGIDQVIQEKGKGVIEFSCGGYDLRFVVTNYDIEVDHLGFYYLEEIDVAVDPKSTVELFANNVTYKLGDLYNYSDIDELNAIYNSEEEPITDDDINEIGYEVRDCIHDWYYKNVYNFTGAEFGDVHPSNASVDQLVEQYGLSEQLKGFDTKPFALHADIFEKLWDGFMNNNLLTTYLSLRMKMPKRQEYVDYFYEFIMDNGEHIKRKEEKRNQ